MSIGTPNFLVPFSEASGLVCANVGSTGGNYTIRSANSPAYTRTASNGLWSSSGTLNGTNNDTTKVTLTTAATAPSATLNSINCAIAFNHKGALNASSAKMVMPGTSTSDGNIRLTLDTPTSSGDFDLNIDFRHTGGAGTAQLNFANLSNNTVYQVACALDAGTASAVVGSATTNTTYKVTASANFTSFQFEGAWPLLLHRSDFPDTNFGFIGDIYYFIYERGTSPWNQTDQLAINTNPTTVPSWPGTGGGAVVGLPNVFMAPNILLRR